MGATVIPVVDEGLGNSAYLVDLSDGRALAVDASRDLRALRAAAERRGLRIGFAADTETTYVLFNNLRYVSQWAHRVRVLNPSAQCHDRW